MQKWWLEIHTWTHSKPQSISCNIPRNSNSLCTGWTWDLFRALGTGTGLWWGKSHLLATGICLSLLFPATWRGFVIDLVQHFWIGPRSWSLLLYSCRPKNQSQKTSLYWVSSTSGWPSVRPGDKVRIYTIRNWSTQWRVRFLAFHLCVPTRWRM